MVTLESPFPALLATHAVIPVAPRQGWCCSGQCPGSPGCSPCWGSWGLFIHQETQQTPAGSSWHLEPEMRWLWPAHTYRLSLFQQNQTVPGAGSKAGWPKWAVGVANGLPPHQQGSLIPVPCPNLSHWQQPPGGWSPPPPPSPSLSLVPHFPSNPFLSTCRL